MELSSLYRADATKLGLRLGQRQCAKLLTNERKSGEHKLIRRKCPPSLVVNAARAIVNRVAEVRLLIEFLALYLNLSLTGPSLTVSTAKFFMMVRACPPYHPIPVINDNVEQALKTSKTD